jgi:hypothetical protein
VAEETVQQQHPAPTETADECPPPWGPFTDYRVKAAVAQQRSTLYTADLATIEPRYNKLDGAQGRYETAWTAQKDKWKDLKRRLERIKEQLECQFEKDRKKELEDLIRCWNDLKKETEDDTAPPNCADIDDETKLPLDCECADLLSKGIAELRRLADLAAACVTQVDTEFDELADLPDKLADQITGLVDRVTKLEEYLAGPNPDPRRGYLQYLDTWRDFCRLKAKLTTAAEYACRLKKLFVLLVSRHTKAICVKVAVHEWEKRKAFEDEAKKQRAKNLIDLVLECAQPKPKPAAESAPPGEKQEQYGGQETPAAGAAC